MLVDVVDPSTTTLAHRPVSPLKGSIAQITVRCNDDNIVTRSDRLPGHIRQSPRRTPVFTAG